MSNYFLLLAAAIAVLAYWNIRVRIADFMQPIRLDVLERAETLIARSDVPDELKHRLEFTLDNLYSAGFAWTFALTFLPASLIMGISRLFRKPKPSILKNMPHRKEYLETMRLGMFCIMSSSPLAFIILTLLAGIALALFLPLPRVFSGLMDSKFLRAFFSGSGHDDHKGHRVAGC